MERKKLSKVLKSHRKVLERRLSALTTSSMDVDSPLLTELLSELKTLRTSLEGQRAAALLYAADECSDSDSDSDDGCDTRSAAALAAKRRAAATAALTGAAAVPQALTSPARMVVSGLGGQVELAVPEPEQGWDWSEEEYRAARFEGAAGRVMVCTGSKCQRKGAQQVLEAVSALADGNTNIEVVPCKCVGKCSAGAALRVRPQGQACATYTQVRPAQLHDMFEEHFGATAAAVTVAGAPPAACCVECRMPGSEAHHHSHSHSHAEGASAVDQPMHQLVA
jgi:(2Fe-2S) ferredoxin